MKPPKIFFFRHFLFELLLFSLVGFSGCNSEYQEALYETANNDASGSPASLILSLQPLENLNLTASNSSSFSFQQDSELSNTSFSELIQENGNHQIQLRNRER